MKQAVFLQAIIIVIDKIIAKTSINFIRLLKKVLNIDIDQLNQAHELILKSSIHQELIIMTATATAG